MHLENIENQRPVNLSLLLLVVLLTPLLILLLQCSGRLFTCDVDEARLDVGEFGCIAAHIPDDKSCEPPTLFYDITLLAEVEYFHTHCLPQRFSVLDSSDVVVSPGLVSHVEM